MSDEVSVIPTGGTFRELTRLEIELIGKLLNLDIPARAALLVQLSSAQARIIDESGSLEFSVSADIAADIADGPIVNAIQTDCDSKPIYGPFINYVLFVKEGRIQELQIYKDDGTVPVENLDPAKILDVYSAR